MKKQLLLLITAATLFSCKKEMAAQTIDNNLQGQNKALSSNKTAFEPAQIEVYNECTQENITFSGMIRYDVMEHYSNGANQVIFKVNFVNVKGIGGVTGTVYHGSIAGIATAKTIQEKPNRIFFVSYHATFTAPGGNQIKIVENIRLIINGQGDVVVSHFEPYTVTCKN